MMGRFSGILIQLKKQQLNFARFGPPLTKLSGSAHDVKVYWAGLGK